VIKTLAAAILGAALLFAGSAHRSLAADCLTDAAGTLANANVQYVGSDWGPIPLWRVTVPSLNMTVDVAANSADEARAAVAATLQCPPAAPGPAPQPPASSSTTTAESDAQAQQLVASAEVTYVGGDWGPLPLWRVTIPSLNMTVDVAAATADDARAAVVHTVSVAIAQRASGGPSASDPTPPATTTVAAPPAPDTTPAEQRQGVDDARSAELDEDGGAILGEPKNVAPFVSAS
jgi:hypothetical protein